MYFFHSWRKDWTLEIGSKQNFCSKSPQLIYMTYSLVGLLGIHTEGFWEHFLKLLRLRNIGKDIAAIFSSKGTFNSVTDSRCLGPLSNIFRLWTNDRSYCPELGNVLQCKRMNWLCVIKLVSTLGDHVDFLQEDLCPDWFYKFWNCLLDLLICFKQICIPGSPSSKDLIRFISRETSARLPCLSTDQQP